MFIIRYVRNIACITALHIIHLCGLGVAFVINRSLVQILVMSHHCLDMLSTHFPVCNYVICYWCKNLEGNGRLGKRCATWSIIHSTGHKLTGILALRSFLVYSYHKSGFVPSFFVSLTEDFFLNLVLGRAVTDKKIKIQIIICYVTGYMFK